MKHLQILSLRCEGQAYHCYQGDGDDSKQYLNFDLHI